MSIEDGHLTPRIADTAADVPARFLPRPDPAKLSHGLDHCVFCRDGGCIVGACKGDECPCSAWHLREGERRSPMMVVPVDTVEDSDSLLTGDPRPPVEHS